MGAQPKPSISKSESLDVDVRFLLANERTLLSWVRTALAVIAGGVAFSQLGAHTTRQVVLGMVVVLMGAAMACIGYMRYRAANDAIRSGHLPIHGNGPKLQVGVVLCFALFVVGFELLSL